MDKLLQVVISGVSQGGVYALIGLGFSLVMMATRILNLSHGAMVLYGGFIFITLGTWVGVHPILLLPVVMLLIVPFGLLTELVLNARATPWRPTSLDAAVLMTLALLVLFEGVAFVVWGPDPRRAPALQPGVVTIGGAVIIWQSIWMILAAAGVTLALHMFLRRTWMGRSMRACAQNTTTAYLLGINARYIGLIAFGLSAAIGALAGVLVSPVTWIDYQMGAFFMLKGMLAYLTGGEEEVAGPLVGGILLGLVENLLLLVPGMTGGFLKQVIPMVLLLVILTVRPRGILARSRAVHA